MRTGLGLGGGCEDHLGQPVGLLQPFGQRNAAEGAGALVVLPPRADEITAHDRLDRQRLEFLHDDRSAPDLRGFVRALDHRLGGRTVQVIWHNVRELPEPEVGHLIQHFALAGNRVG